MRPIRPHSCLCSGEAGFIQGRNVGQQRRTHLAVDGQRPQTSALDECHGGVHLLEQRAAEVMGAVDAARGKRQLAGADVAQCMAFMALDDRHSAHAFRLFALCEHPLSGYAAMSFESLGPRPASIPDRHPRVLGSGPGLPARGRGCPSDGRLCRTSRVPGPLVGRCHRRQLWVLG